MRFYTGIGSRNPPEEILHLMRKLGEVLCDLGWVLRSGGAEGADTAFHEGAMRSHHYHQVGMEIFLPWNGFNLRDRETSGKFWIPAPWIDNYWEAESIAKTLHPVWDRLGRGPKALHTRNVYQVLGLDLATPSRVVLCWAPPIKGGPSVRGGTNTAVQLALKYGVPVYNLHIPEIRNRAIRLVTEGVPLSDHQDSPGTKEVHAEVVGT